MMSGIWMLTSTIYYLIDFQLRFFGGDVYSNTMAVALVGIPASLFSGYLVQKAGVKISLIVFSTITVVGSILLITLFNYKSLMPYMIFISKGGIAAMFSVTYIANSQLFPAIFAGTAFGIGNFSGKMMSLFAPMLAELEEPIPLYIVSVLAVLLFMVSLFLKPPPIESPSKTKTLTSDSLLTK